LADVAAEFEAIRARQHHVEEEQGRHLPDGLGQHGMAADKALYLKAGGPQIVGNETSDILIVFDNKNNRMKGAGARVSSGAIAGFGWQVHFASGCPPKAHRRRI
jgi:hypothetical protein